MTRWPTEKRAAVPPPTRHQRGSAELGHIVERRERQARQGGERVKTQEPRVCIMEIVNYE